MRQVYNFSSFTVVCYALNEFSPCKAQAEQRISRGTLGDFQSFGKVTAHIE